MNATEGPRELRAKQIREDAQRAFADHKLAAYSEDRVHYDETGRWMPYHACDLITTRFGQLIVVGDVSHVIFGHYSDSRDILGFLRWMSTDDFDYYVMQKASIGGMRDGSGQAARTLMELFDRDVARYDLKKLAGDARERNKLDIAKVYARASAELRDEAFGRESLVLYLYERLPYDEVEGGLSDIGMVTDLMARARTVAARRRGRQEWAALLRRCPDANREMKGHEFVVPLPESGPEGRVAIVAWTALAGVLGVKIGFFPEHVITVVFDFPLIPTMSAALRALSSDAAEAALVAAIGQKRLRVIARAHVRKVLVSYRDRGHSPYRDTTDTRLA